MSNTLISLNLNKEPLIMASILIIACIAILIATLARPATQPGLKPFIYVLMGGIAVWVTAFAGTGFAQVYLKVDTTIAIMEESCYSIENLNNRVVLRSPTRQVEYTKKEFCLFKDARFDDVVELTLLQPY